MAKLRLLNHMLGRLIEPTKEKRYRNITSGYDFNGFKRIYLIHIRKTGGTSLNNMFLSLSGEDHASLYERLAASPLHRVLSNGLVFVGWNVALINKGNYFYGFSHTPLYQLKLPAQTFTITCFRDPASRVISHYRMLMEYRDKNVDHPCMSTEGEWLGSSFEDFLRRIPKEHLCNQLYMFSPRFDVDEAVKRVANLSHYFFVEDFQNGIAELCRKTGLKLSAMHIRKSSNKYKVSDKEMKMLREMQESEYAFLDRIRNMNHYRQPRID
ncbi:MAG: sulfotransferase family 2 domain-containing protein [Gammaproteobacteria bacterium]